MHTAHSAASDRPTPPRGARPAGLAPGPGGAPDPRDLTVIVGLGKTGLACARHLARRREPIAVTDTRVEPPALATLRRELPGVELHLGGLDERLLGRASRIVVSPGVSRQEPALERAARRGIPLVADIELFFQCVDAPVTAITGSNGKSTVTAMLAEMLKADGKVARVGGNFGPPALELLGGDPDPDLYVLELSSFQLESTYSLRTRAAALLNITPDHMDRYRRFEDYAAAKRRVFTGAEVLIVNRDDPRAGDTPDDGRPVIGFTAGPPTGRDFGLVGPAGELWLARGRERLLPRGELRVPGIHNAVNGLAALAIGGAVGLSMAAMRAGLRAFHGLPHRCQLVSGLGGARWYNDSKGTNVGAAVAAIEGVGDAVPVVLIAGGLGKGADFRPLREALRGRGRGAVLLGEAAEEIARAIGGEVPVRHAGDMDEAVAAARRLLRPGDGVLLSPACASFDMFDGYEARGEAFVRALRRAEHGG